MQNTYITTPIYYVNDSAHIGHAYTTIIADFYARRARLAGQKTLFLTGCDEHGQKIEESAQRAGRLPQEFTDEVSERFRELWRELKISNDIFMRTTAPEHCARVQAIFDVMKARGDIYKGEYEGHYCVSCESFYAPNSLGAGDTCPDCGKATRMLKEESYFFALSRYEGRLLDWIERNPAAIVPEGKRNEVIAFIRQGLRDLSVTRTSFSWGIPVRGDEKHVIYVWLDALCNYISALGYDAATSEWGAPCCLAAGAGECAGAGAGAAAGEFWPASVHFVGKDILKFHAIYWPAFLMSLGLPLPRTVAAHGWWTVEGAKMSKSVGNVIAPRTIADAVGIDSMRYFLLSAMPFGNDGDFSAAALQSKLNAELCNEFGNLLSRTLSLSAKFFGGRLSGGMGRFEAEWAAACEHFKAADEALQGFSLHEFCARVMAALRVGNGAMAKHEPWALAKSDPAAAQAVLVAVCNILRAAVLELAPVLIETAPKMAQALGISLNAADFAARYEALAEFATGENFHAFARLEKLPEFGASAGAAGASGQKATPSENPKSAAGQAAQTAASEASETIKIDDFAKIDMRIATVLSCEAVEGSEKLLKFSLDVGEERPRQVLSGIAKFYEPRELEGRQIVLLANLAARKIFKHLSEGMILSAKNSDESLVLLSPLAPCEPGARIG